MKKIGKLNEIIKEARKAGMIRNRKTKPRQAWFDTDCKDKRKEVWKDLKTYLRSKKEGDTSQQEKEIEGIISQKKDAKARRKMERSREQSNNNRILEKHWKIQSRKKGERGKNRERRLAEAFLSAVGRQN